MVGKGNKRGGWGEILDLMAFQIYGEGINLVLNEHQLVRRQVLTLEETL